MMNTHAPLILVVEDDIVMRLQICQAMKHEGYTVIEATDGKQALDCYAESHPDIVLLDAIMPVMDGFTCCTQLQSLPEGERTPVLMITGLNDEDSVDRAFAAGASDYITKPIHWAVLRQRVRHLLRAKQAEDEIYNALAQEKELRRLKSRFVSMVSHELRSPLTRILLTTDLLKFSLHKFDDERKLYYLNQVGLEIKRMAKLLDDILLVGKSESGKIDFNPTYLDLEALCREIIAEIKIEDSQNHTFIFTCEGNCYKAEIDQKFLHQILNNLLLNAIKYSPAGGKIELNLVCENEEVIFEIKDEGIGIPASDQLLLFELFYRATNVGNIMGTGLGLAIIKNAIELHGGSIRFISQVNVGTTFTVCLPIHQTQNRKYPRGL